MTKESTTKTVSKPKTVAEYINWQIQICGKSQKQIATEAGFEKPNIITMFKQGQTKIPIEKIGRLAEAIEVDAVYLYKLCMQEYQPDTWREIQKMFNQPILTENEVEIIEAIRSCNVANPKIRTDEDRIRLAEVINSFKSDNEAST